MNIELIYEFIGTAILILFGGGVVANVILKGTKSFGAGWLTITIGWGFAVFLAVTVAGPHSGAHLNPAVTIGLAAANMFEWAKVPGFIIAQMAGAFFGAVLVFLVFKTHFDVTEDKGAKLGVFSTSPAIANTPFNLISEIIGTFALVFIIFNIVGPSLTVVAPELAAPEFKIGLGSIGALPVAILVIAIGISLGGTTGYAINPARDLGPRIAHFLLPIKDKGDSGWGYSWIPVVGPVIGALLAALLFNILK